MTLIMSWFRVIVLTLCTFSVCTRCELAQNETLMSEALSLGSFRQARRGATVDGCTTSTGYAGSCMTRVNCLRQGGTANGYCGTFSICCETNMACNTVSRLKRTIITNPAAYSDITDTCLYTIEPYSFSSNVCQLLIQFQKFDMQQPTLTDNLLECNDYMMVDNYKLCGDNTGQHIYIPFNVAGGVERVTITFNLANRYTSNSWNLVVTQLECPVVKRHLSAFSTANRFNGLNELRTIFNTHNADLDLLAPPGCDQFYTASSGNVKSFNFRETGGTYYMANTNYVMCFKQLPGATDISYTIRKFSLSVEDPTSAGMDTDCHAEVYTMYRKEDYLMIPQSQWYNNPNNQATYYCDTSLPEREVLRALPPFIMYFNSDDQTDTTETGFSIDYRLNSVISG